MNSRKIKTKETVSLSIDFELMKAIRANKNIENFSSFVEKLIRKELKL